MLKTTYAALSNGTVRTQDARIIHLYQKADAYKTDPCLWEGLFRIACLIKNNPLEEPVTGFIYEGIRDTENGSFAGTPFEQICKARAAMALFEYNTDKTILKRLAVWIRYLEVEFDHFTGQNSILYQPADLMEFLLRYYCITGMKSVLRICTRLRSSAFDWTTVLHTFQQSIPLNTKESDLSDMDYSCKPDELEYDQKEKLINHAEMLADGMRYSTYAGIFSGHGQELSSGRVLWEHLKKHHMAVCGGTTANPFLCGRGADKKVSTGSLAAWIEAFCAQIMLPESEWANDELIRIIFNGFALCLEQEDLPDYQKVNMIGNKCSEQAPSALLYSRVTRAAASIYRYAVMIGNREMRINYLFPGKYMSMIDRQPVILQMKDETISLQCRKEVSFGISIYKSNQNGEQIVLKHNGQTSEIGMNDTQGKGNYIQTVNTWNSGDEFRFFQYKTVRYEETHHQGVCFLYGNRLLSADADHNHYDFAVSSLPEFQADEIIMNVSETGKWPIRDEEPADIPVLPVTHGSEYHVKMHPYYQTKKRITIFPKAEDTCLK